MEENEQIQNNAGDPTGGEPVSADPGNTGVDPTGGNPNGSGAPQTDPRNAELDKYKAEVRRLNRVVVESRRSGKSQNQPNGGNTPYTPDMLSTPEGQYAASIEIADARLRGGLEDRLSLYPEISDQDKARIRTNPWAFASREAFFSGDYSQALDEIELMLVDKADEAGNSSATPTNQNPQGNNRPQPAAVNSNPAPEPVNPAGAVPGSAEDANPWTMPIDQLERLAKKQFQDMQAR